MTEHEHGPELTNLPPGAVIRAPLTDAELTALTERWEKAQDTTWMPLGSALHDLKTGQVIARGPKPERSYGAAVLWALAIVLVLFVTFLGVCVWTLWLIGMVLG